MLQEDTLMPLATNLSCPPPPRGDLWILSHRLDLVLPPIDTLPQRPSHHRLQARPMHIVGGEARHQVLSAQLVESWTRRRSVGTP